MFRTTVSVVLSDRRGQRAVLQRTITLPFLPAVGHELGFSGIHADYWSGEVVTALWDVEAGEAHVELEDWCSFRFSMEEMLAEMGPAWVRLS